MELLVSLVDGQSYWLEMGITTVLESGYYCLLLEFVEGGVQLREGLRLDIDIRLYYFVFGDSLDVGFDSFKLVGLSLCVLFGFLVLVDSSLLL